MITALVMQSTDVLAQLNTDLTPTPPAGSGGLIYLGRILMWCCLLGGILAIVYGGGKFGWEKWTGGAVESPKIIAASMIGGIVSVSASQLMDAVISHAH
ncbi:hypothetical protein [Nocardia terpenica]|uniref:Uncharacterized protein n=1 Tax=Nocardia terpenica TaxID=455432 RepID=A0A291RZ30_9NOCA|nr:hypothetical protein [Nocardia terpenica]ATL72542.1 hypothetical protein CRH09_39935 [Nocardia terpenica]